MQSVFEFLCSAVFILFLLVQVALVGMIVLARILKASGLLKEGRDQDGFRGFMQGFC